jgi:hypothetical protein
MGEARQPSTQIGRLNMRISAANAEAGKRIASSVANTLSDGLPGVGQPLGAVNIRLRVASGATESDIGNAIADSIRNALSRNRR